LEHPQYLQEFTAYEGEWRQGDIDMSNQEPIMIVDTKAQGPPYEELT